ncbi:hypothetical protein TNCV_4343751 [Trichonephila clavipes]|nr:hypothetical protein TNCV_4343751 [Trichonephila clavipes]
MAVFGVQPENSDRNAVRVIDKIAQYQAGRYSISSNEAVWRIFSFRVHFIFHVETCAYITVDYEYACPTSKRSISRGILTTVTGHWKWTAANS